MIKFFRGISVPFDEFKKTIDTISADGLGGISPKARWHMRHEFLNNIEILYLKSDLTLNDTRDNSKLFDAVCACGDVEGAYYYSNFHNRTYVNSSPIIIEFEAPLSSVKIDGRDFLYTIFQGGDPSKATSVLRECFGEPVLKYAERAWKSQDQKYRIAQCDLATNDREVIQCHYKNKSILAGRYRTKYKSAFTVTLPIQPNNIISVRSTDGINYELNPDIHLDDLLLPKY